MDYRKLRLERNEVIRYALEAGALTGLVGFCFYNSLAALLLYPLVLLFYLRYKTKTRIWQRREELKLQFKDAVQAIAAALRAGYSAENAVAEAGRDLTRMYSEKADMVQELAKCGYPVPPWLWKPPRRNLMPPSSYEGCSRWTSPARPRLFAFPWPHKESWARRR